MPNTIQMNSGDAATVQEAQYYLVNLMYLPANTASGVFGPIMMGAVQAFQRQNGLSVDGIIGPNTWRVLTSSSAVGANGVPVPSSGTNVSTPVRPSGANVKPSGVSDNAAWDFAPLDVYGQMPSTTDKLKAKWAALPTPAKIGIVAGSGLLLLVVFGSGRK